MEKEREGYSHFALHLILVELDESRVNTFAVFNNNGAYRRSPMRGIALTTASSDCDQISTQQLVARLAGTADDGAPEAEAAGIALAAAGFRTIWLDECWLPPRGERSPDNFDALTAHPVTFPDGLAPIADAAHAANLSLGVYVSASPYACGDAEREGSLDFYVTDSRALAAAGVDAVRIDQCASPDDLSAIMDEIDGAGNLRMSEHFRTSDSKAGRIIDEIRASDARKFVLAWNMTGREVWMNVRCADWRDEAGVRMEAPLWCRRAAHAVFGVPGLPRHAHSWRSTVHVGESLRQRTHFAIMEPQIDAGYVYGAGTEQDGEHSTEDEAEAALALLAIAGTPLILASRLDALTPRFLRAITNEHLLSIHADPAMIAGDYVGNVNCTHRYLQGRWEVRDACQLWLKPLADGGYAALLFNADSDILHTMNLDFVKVFGVPVRADVLDIYGHLDEAWLPRTEFVQVDVRPRHAALIRLSAPHSVLYRKGGLPSITPAPIPERDGDAEDD